MLAENPNMRTRHRSICCTARQPCYVETNLFSENERHVVSLYLRVKGSRYNPGLWRSLPMYYKLSANQTAGLESFLIGCVRWML